LLQLDIEDLIHAESINRNALLTCSESSKSLNVWNCSLSSWNLSEELIGQHSFDEPILKCSTIRSPRLNKHAIIKVTLETGVIHYLRVTDEQRFPSVATLNEKPGKQSIFLDLETDVYYCE
jgi:hypothetical protein